MLSQSPTLIHSILHLACPLFLCFSPSQPHRLSSGATSSKKPLLTFTSWPWVSITLCILTFLVLTPQLGCGRRWHGS